MMYKIDWNKYLSTKRYRQSTSTQNGNVDEYVDKRNPFESDFGRVIFSSAMRRMHDKAQVVPLTSGDNVHTRLTHSMEVLSMAYSLGIDLCRDKDFRELYTPEELIDLERKIPVILKTVAFVHDIGNPPFGHFGENIIQNYFKGYLQKRHITDKQALDFVYFDGNAEGFRILNRLQFIGDLAGLNLTYATLAAYLKYPNDDKLYENYIGTKKHGVFTSESDILKDVIDACAMRRDDGQVKRHPLSFLVEAADSICYNIMDVEDGFTMGWYTFDDVIKFINEHAKDDYNQEEYDVLKVLNLDFEEKRISNGDGRRKMCDFRVAVTRHFVELAIKNFKANLESIDKGTYSKELIEDGDFLSEIFQKFADQYIYPQREIEQIELTGYSVLNGLLDILTKCAFSSNSKIRNHLKSIFSRTFMKVAMREIESKRLGLKITRDYKFYSDEDLFKFDIESLDTYTRLRMIVDFISGMTDKYAVSLYQQMSGQKLK